MLLAGLLAASLVAILTTFGIIASLIFETVRFFNHVNAASFLFGTQWAPDTMAPETANFDGTLGAVPLFWGTFYIGAVIAMIVAIPFGLLSAVYLTQYASPATRRWVKPILEILAGIPTVVYGYFAALTVAPLVRDLASALGMENPSTESVMAAGLVMGVMIIPFVSSMADDSIAAVPQAMRDGSLAMGATTSETVKKVLVPAALPGIIAGVMLAISRAIGETMIVVMAAGAAANMSLNPFASATTVTFQISALLTGKARPITRRRWPPSRSGWCCSASPCCSTSSRSRSSGASGRLMTDWNSPDAAGRLGKRYAAERRFRLLGLAAIVLSLAFLATLLFIMLRNGIAGLNWQFLSGSDSTDAALAGVWGATKGSLLTMAVTLALVVPARGARGDLSGGIRAAQPLDRLGGSVDQQPGRRPIDHFRPAGPRGLHPVLRAAALGAAGRRA